MKGVVAFNLCAFLVPLVHAIYDHAKMRARSDRVSPHAGQQTREASLRQKTQGLRSLLLALGPQSQHQRNFNRRFQSSVMSDIRQSLKVIREPSMPTPLANKRILLLSSRQETEDLASAIARFGGRPVWCPAVRTDPLDDYSDLDFQMQLLVNYDAVFLRTFSAIDVVFDRAGGMGSSNPFVGVPVAALGDDVEYLTSKSDEGEGVAVTTPSGSESLIENFQPMDILSVGKRLMVLSPCPEEAMNTTPASIKTFITKIQESGVEVDVACTGKLVQVEKEKLEVELNLLRSGKIDAIIVTSVEEVHALDGDVWAADSLPIIFAFGVDVVDALEEVLDRNKALDGLDIFVVQVPEGLGRFGIMGALERHFGEDKMIV